MRPLDARVSDYITAMGGKPAAIFVAILIAALSLGALVLIQQQGSDKPLVKRQSENPFYFEGSVVLLGEPVNGARPESSKTTLQWWYERPGVWHWQLDTTPADDEPITVISVADGRNAYLYKSDTNTYTRTSIDKFVAAGLPVDFLLGPVDVSQQVASWEANDTVVRNGGAALVMGRDTQILEYTPTWHSSGAGGDRQGGIGRIWVDSDSGLVLRNLVDGGPTSTYLDARITLLNLEPKFDNATFVFDVPPGATLVK